MKQLRKFLDWALPSYARLCALAIILMDVFAYYVPKALDAHRVLHPISTALDDALPLVPPLVIVYVLAYVQWVFGLAVILRDSRERCFRFTAAVLTGMFLAMLVMLIWPTVLAQPRLEVRDPFTWLLNAIYRADEPTHVFPSMHCLASWFCFRGAFGLRQTPRWYPWVQGVFSLLVFVSVVLVKQHVWPDILGGIAAAELGLGLSRLLRLHRLTAKLDPTARRRSYCA